MITLITGAPGAGKTALLVLLLQELLGLNGRQVFVHGIPDLVIPHEELTDPDKWYETVPDGAVIVIDEVQTVWRPRGPGQKVPDHISKLETHRHRGIDFYIITQGPNLVDSNVRALVGRHIHLRDIGFMGRWWYEWPETADQCRTSWKNAPIKKKYKLPSKIFGQYKSASVHIKPIRSFPKMFIVAILALIAAGLLVWKAYGSVAAKINPAAVAVSPSVPGSNAPGRALLPRSGPVDEALDFHPRAYNRPWTAPAYDDLRKVVAMPSITGAICVGQKCKCYDSKHYLPEVSSEACLSWSENPPFNPYVASEILSVGNQNPANSAPVQPASTTTPGVSSRGPV